MLKKLKISLLFILCACSETPNQLPFWQDTKLYTWDNYHVNQSVEQNNFLLHPVSFLQYGIAYDYPLLEWAILIPEQYKVSTNLMVTAVRYGACLTDMAYLAMYGRFSRIEDYKNLCDTFEYAMFKGFDLPGLRLPQNTEQKDSIFLWTSASIGSLPLKIHSLNIKEPIIQGISYGIWLESMYLMAYSAAFKESVDLFLWLENYSDFNQKYSNYLTTFNHPFCNDWSQEVSWLNSKMTVTHQVQEWDSLENQWIKKIYPLKEPVIDLHKSFQKTREKWLLE